MVVWGESASRSIRLYGQFGSQEKLYNYLSNKMGIKCYKDNDAVSRNDASANDVRSADAIPRCKRRCQNGGICVNGKNRCKCPEGFRGRFCQKRECKFFSSNNIWPIWINEIFEWMLFGKFSFLQHLTDCHLAKWQVTKLCFDIMWFSLLKNTFDQLSIY